MIQSNQDISEVAVYAGIAGAGAVGAHATITAIRDAHIRSRKEAERKQRLQEKQAAKEAKRAAKQQSSFIQRYLGDASYKPSAHVARALLSRGRRF